MCRSWLFFGTHCLALSTIERLSNRKLTVQGYEEVGFWESGGGSPEYDEW